MQNKNGLKRRLERLVERKNLLEAEHKGNELNFTYWGGFSLGYLKGQINELENMIEADEERGAKLLDK